MESVLLKTGFIGLDDRQLTAESCWRTSVSYSFRYVWYIRRDYPDYEYREFDWEDFLNKKKMLKNTNGIQIMNGG